MRIVPILPAVAILASGCIPERDNPHDDVNRPSASLRVIDLGNPNGACKPLTTFDPAQYGAVDAVSRGRCIGLDASLTEDPQGDRYRLTFTWSADGSAESVIGTIEPDAPVKVLPLEPAWIRANLPARRAVTFRAIATVGASSDVATAVYVPLNSPPVAVAPPPRHLVGNGLPWSPGEDHVIPFHAAYADPDGDPPQEFCWRFRTSGVDEEVCRPAADDPAFTRVIPVSPLQRYSGTVTASDGDLESQVDSTYVLLAGSVAIARDDQDGFFALDGLRPLPIPAPSNGNVLVFAAGDKETFVTIAQYSPDWAAELRDAVSGDVLDDIFISGDFISGNPAYDAARGRVWLAGIGANGARFRSYLVTDQSLAPELSDVDLGFPVNNPPTIAAVDDGSVWMIGPPFAGDQKVVHAFPDGSFDLFHEETACCLRPPIARPERPEAWAPFLSSGNVDSQLYRFTEDAATPQVIETSGYRVRAIGWIDANRFWAISDNEGALLIDAETAIEAGEIAPAIELVEESVATALWIACDPSTPICHAGGPSEGWRLDGFGAEATPGMTSGYTGGSFIGRYVDSIGAVWGSGPERFLSTRPDRAIYEFHRLAEVTAADPRTGGLWVSGNGPLFQVAPDGRIVHEVTQVLADGVVEPVDSFAYLWMEPGGALWGYGSGGFVRIDDPESDLPRAHRFVATSPDDMRFLAPGRGPGGPVAWHTHADYLDKIALLTTTGTVTFPLTFAESSVDTRGAVSPVTSALCLITSTSSTSPSTVHARRVSTSGAVDDFGALSADPVTAIAHSRTADGTDDLCWMATANPNPGADADGCAAGLEGRIRAWRPGAGLVVDECVEGKVLSLRPSSEDDLLFTSVADGTDHRLVVGYVPAGTLTFVEYETPSNRELVLLP